MTGGINEMILKPAKPILFISFLILTCKSDIQFKAINLSKFEDSIHHWNLFHDQGRYQRYTENQIIEIADNLIRYQNEDGGWPKNMDWLAIINIDSFRQSLSERENQSTLDNNNVFSQIEYLSKVYDITNREVFKISAVKGINYLLNSQNESGGWRGWDVDAITYNDQVMTGVMHLFLDITEQKEYFSWLSNSLLDSVKNSLNKAIVVTLQCQIVVDGKKTAWCQQHDHGTLKPVKARSYELPSITARESIDVIRFLMRLPEPSTEIIESVKSAVKWLEQSKIYGIRLDKIKLDDEKIINEEYPYDLIVVNDPIAEPIWSRYYDIKTNKPFLCRRDGTVVYSLEKISPERRTGYAWYGYWPAGLLQKEYPEWLKKNNLPAN